jgi:hypothetical protein
MIAIAAGGVLTWVMNCRARAIHLMPGIEAWRRLVQSIARIPRAIVHIGA